MISVLSYSTQQPSGAARHRRGDVRQSDGKIFWAYQSSGKETWLSFEQYGLKREKSKENWKKYSRGEAYANNAERRRANIKKYQKSPRGRAKVAEWRRSAKSKEREREYQRRPHVVEGRRAKEKARYHILKQDPDWVANKRAADRARRQRMKAAGIVRNRRPKKYNPQTYREKYRKDARYQFTSRIRSRVYQAIRNGSGSKQTATEELVGCSFDYLRQHIERQFKGSMSWDNPSSFHIDHIVPLASFDLTDPAQLKVACNWQNLRPIPPKKNMSKGAKLTEPQMPLPISFSINT
jgi:hypothetical protein